MVPAPKTEEEAEGVQGAGALYFGWHNDVHVLNVPAMSWEQPEITGAPPTMRAAHTANALGNTMLVFGGRDMKGRTNDLHALDTTSMQWASIDTRQQPSKRSFHSAAVICADDGSARLLVFGGVDVNARHHASLHSLSFGSSDRVAQSAAEEWEEVCVSGEGPSPRGNCGFGVIGNNIFVFGGSSDWDKDTNMCTTFHGDNFMLTC